MQFEAILIQAEFPDSSGQPDAGETAVRNSGQVPACVTLTLRRAEQATALTKDYDPNSSSRSHLDSRERTECDYVCRLTLNGFL